MENTTGVFRFSLVPHETGPHDSCVKDATLTDYYAARAPEYDRVYEKPERQGDLAKLRALVRETFRGADVVDIACGTGYWTEILAEVARSVVAIDINDSVLQIAARRR